MHRPRPRASNATRQLALCLAWGLVALACGGAPSPPSSPEPFPEPPESNAPESGAESEGPSGPPTSGYGQPAPGTPVAPPPTAKPDNGGLGLGGTTADGLFEQFRAAEAELMSAGNVCDRACRALRSMQRAAHRLCEIAASPEELHRCQSARDRVREARDRVRVACQTCADGPPLDDDPR